MWKTWYKSENSAIQIILPFQNLNINLPYDAINS